ncbi:histidine kinase N-terminal 7TM domain-containing protein [Chloroflexota bacterium]
MSIVSFLRTLGQILEAGIAVTALSLFIRSLTFNLRERVSRSFAIVLACVMAVFSGEAISSASASQTGIEFWLRFQWVGIVLFPAALIHFADALLETTGRPSRGRRSRGVRVMYAISGIFLALLPFGLLVGAVVMEEGPVPYLERTPGSALFTVFYLVAAGFSGWGIWRAYRRTRLTVSRRRMRYLMAGAFFLVIGTYPYLQLGSGFSRNLPLLFLSLAILGNLLVFVFMVLMAYAVAFFGAPWPDRLVKSRLVKWFLRGPLTVFFVLILMTIAHETGSFFGAPYTVTIPIITVTTVLLMEHVLTLVFPLAERWFFNGGERENIQLLQELSDRLITSGDLKQFLEAVLASVCDKFQVSTAFIADLNPDGIESVVQFGDRELLNKIGLDQALLEEVSAGNGQENGRKMLFAWGDFWLYPLHSSQNGELLGLMGVLQREDHQLEAELTEALAAFGQRAALALEDRRLQRQVFTALEALTPKVDLIQRLRAATRYDQADMLGDLELGDENSLSNLVKDALSHYWGGPKLTESPLMRLQVVQKAMIENEGNPANALRSILREGIERVRPEGERRFTAEWILYNILEMKFMEGRKVREVALRLAMSEADLYRKQRVAIEEVAKALADMERVAREGKSEIIHEREKN